MVTPKLIPTAILATAPVHVGLESASVTLDGHQVLSAITVRFDLPQVTVIMGPNGAGKSTFLSAIAGLVPLTEGGRYRRTPDGADVPITRLGYVLQKPVMFRRSVLGNCHIAMQGAGLNPSAHLALRDDILSLMEIDHLSHKSAYQLSQGERQRLAVARVMLMQPGILMLDEATNSLDQYSVDLLERLVRIYADAGMPVLWVTHSRDQAKRIADRVITIDRGVITGDAPADAYFSGQRS